MSEHLIDIDFTRFRNKLRTRLKEVPPVLAPVVSSGKRAILKTKPPVPVIYDPVRKKYLVRTPEEEVRQLVLLFLTLEKGYPGSRIVVEKELMVNEMKKRCDILAFGKNGQPQLLVECKAPDVPINEGAFRQISWYNMPLRVPYLMITNGNETYCCEIDYQNNDFCFLDSIPPFSASFSQ